MPTTNRQNLSVFISHSTEKNSAERNLATALYKELKSEYAYIRVFLDCESAINNRWRDRITTEILQADVALILLTRRVFGNIEAKRPDWVGYEAANFVFRNQQWKRPAVVPVFFDEYCLKEARTGHLAPLQLNELQGVMLSPLPNAGTSEHWIAKSVAQLIERVHVELQSLDQQTSGSEDLLTERILGHLTFLNNKELRAKSIEKAIARLAGSSKDSSGLLPDSPEAAMKLLATAMTSATLRDAEKTVSPIEGEELPIEYFRSCEAMNELITCYTVSRTNDQGLGECTALFEDWRLTWVEPRLRAEYLREFTPEKTKQGLIGIRDRSQCPDLRDDFVRRVCHTKHSPPLVLELSLVHELPLVLESPLVLEVEPTPGAPDKNPAKTAIQSVYTKIRTRLKIKDDDETIQRWLESRNTELVLLLKGELADHRNASKIRKEFRTALIIGCTDDPRRCAHGEGGGDHLKELKSWPNQDIERTIRDLILSVAPFKVRQ